MKGFKGLVWGLALLLDLIFTRHHIPEIGFEKGMWTICPSTGSRIGLLGPWKTAYPATNCDRQIS